MHPAKRGGLRASRPSLRPLSVPLVESADAPELRGVCMQHPERHGARTEGLPARRKTVLEYAMRHLNLLENFPGFEILARGSSLWENSLFRGFRKKEGF